MRNIFIAIWLSLFVSFGYAAEVKPLPPEQAFVFNIYVDEHDNITFQWNIAPGYYLYQDKFNFTLAPTSQVKIGKIAWPKSINHNHHDISSSIYSGLLKLTLPLVGAFRGPMTLTITYQGCSLGGFCYAPVQKYLKVDLMSIKPMESLLGHVSMVADGDTFISDQDAAQQLFVGHSMVATLFGFLLLGLLLAFTPCVLPMVPILSGIIVGHKQKVSTRRAFGLSLAYVLGMAVTYAIAGIVVASLGHGVQAALQNPWVISLFSLLFVLLALSLFGVYELQLPASWQQHTTRWNQYFSGGAFFSVFCMGCLSTLIVSPCVSAPLVGVLAYIAQTGDKVLGGLALLMLGLGMGMPLLLIGTSAGKWLPKAGPWMDFIKKLFAILMLGVAVWMLSRILHGSIILILWGMLAIFSGMYLSFFYKIEIYGRNLQRIIGALLLFYGVILMTGAGLGNDDPLHPWNDWGIAVTKTSEKTVFTTVKNKQDLLRELKLAKKQHLPVILDFYADWCTSCVYMDRNVLNQNDVHDALNRFMRLRLDVTTSTDSNSAVMAMYNVVAPPTMILFDAQGKELSSQRIVGEVNAKELLNRLSRVVN